MDRIAFRELLLRYASGTASPEEKVLIDHWYELLYNNNLPALKQDELDDIEQEMWTYIEKEGVFLERSCCSIHLIATNAAGGCIIFLQQLLLLRWL